MNKQYGTKQKASRPSSGMEIKFPGYAKVHDWIKSNYGKATKCSNPECKSGNYHRFEWALRKGCTYENNIENFMQLCASCHRRYDVTDEFREKISKAHKGRAQPAVVKPVISICKKTGKIEEFESIISASLQTGTINTGISNALLGNSKSSNGRIWKYKEKLPNRQ